MDVTPGPRRRVAVLVSGRGSNMMALAEACREPSFPAEIALVLSNRPDAGALERAAKLGIETAVVDHKAFDSRLAFEDAVHDRLVDAKIDIICLAGFMRILSGSFVGRWQGKMLNVHPSLLPSFPGLDTHARALEAGVRLHGCTVHIVTPELDAGPIVVQAAIPVFNRDTPESLATRLITEEHRCYVVGLRLMAAGRLTLEGERVLIDRDEEMAGPSDVLRFPDTGQG